MELESHAPGLRASAAGGTRDIHVWRAFCFVDTKSTIILSSPNVDRLTVLAARQASNIMIYPDHPET
eukprot:1031107-Amphidinium_carterae.1